MPSERKTGRRGGGREQKVKAEQVERSRKDGATKQKGVYGHTQSVVHWKRRPNAQLGWWGATGVEVHRREGGEGGDGKRQERGGGGGCRRCISGSMMCPWRRVGRLCWLGLTRQNWCETQQITPSQSQCTPYSWPWHHFPQNQHGWRWIHKQTHTHLSDLTKSPWSHTVLFRKWMCLHLLHTNMLLCSHRNNIKQLVTETREVAYNCKYSLLCSASKVLLSS